MIAKLLGGGLMAGVGLRAATGLRDLFTQDSSPYKARTGAYPIALKANPADEEEKVASVNPHVAPTVSNPAGGNPLPRYGGLQKPTELVHQFLGMDQNSPGAVSPPEGAWDDPRTWAIGIPGGLALGYLGYQAVDGLADWRRKRERQSALDNVKGEYDSLLAQLSKSGSEEAPLDDLADAFEKSAGVVDKTVGLYGAVAALTALASGAAAYSFGSGRSKRKLIQEAMRQRAKRRLAGVQPSGSPDYVYLA